MRGEIEFAVGYSEPQAGSDAANMQLKAEKVPGGWKLNGQKIWTTSAHFADWYWLGARTDPEKPKHDGISLFLIPMNHPGLTIQATPTIGDERTNTVFFNDVFVPDDYLVGEARQRLPVHLGGARPRALHDVHLLADRAEVRGGRSST